MVKLTSRTLPFILKAFKCVLFMLASLLAFGQEAAIITSTTDLALSSIRGESSKPGTLLLVGKSERWKKLDFDIVGSQTKYFRLISDTPEQTENGDSIKFQVLFQPDTQFIGIAQAQIKVKSGNKKVKNFTVRGLSTKALEGKNEPPLSDVLSTLGYKINLGWQTLANHVRAEQQGDELPGKIFRKLGSRKVELIPVARYSPSFSLPFGFYLNTDSTPTLHEIGVLSGDKSYPEHQTLFPGLEKGGSDFDPGDALFGIFTTSPSHVAYSEDKWNGLLYPDHATHACRIYEAKNWQGVLVPDQYLICFEEAANGDYQDYVFILKNVRLIK